MNTREHIISSIISARQQSKADIESKIGYINELDGRLQELSRTREYVLNQLDGVDAEAMQEIDGYGGAFDLAEEEIEEMKRELGHLVYDDYDRLIQLCDNISGASGIMRMEDRIADIQSRYPRYPEEKKIITLRLVDYFSRKTGADIYDLACGGNLVDHY